MFKKGLILFVIILLAALISGCKGSRKVRVVVENVGRWYVHINEDTGATTRTGYFTESFDLGNNEENVTVEAWRLTSTAYYHADNLRDLTIKIVEEYDNGFLYTKSSVVKAQITNTYKEPVYCEITPSTLEHEFTYKMNNPLAIATVTYDFSSK